MKSRYVLLLIPCLFLCALFFLVLPQRPPEKAVESVNLDFFQMREEALSGFTRVIRDFEEAEGGIHVDQQNVSSALELFLARMQRNDLPSVFTFWPTQLSFRKLVEKGQVRALTDEDFLSRVDPAALEMVRSEDGEIYALPVNYNCVEIFYNRSVFEQYGLEIPRTLDELLNLCRTLAGKGITPCVFSRRDGRISHVAQGILAALCPDYLTVLERVGSGSASPEEENMLRRALHVMYTFTCMDQETPLYTSEANQYFCEGKAAMYYTGSYVLGDLMNLQPGFDMGVFPFPGYTPDSRVLLGSVDTALCISADCAQTDAALTFLEFLTRPETATAYANLDLEASCIMGVRQEHPVSREMAAHIAGYEHAEWIKNRFSYECSNAFETAVRAYVLDGDLETLMAKIREIF